MQPTTDLELALTRGVSGAGITKQDVYDDYSAVAPLMLEDIEPLTPLKFDSKLRI